MTSELDRGNGARSSPICEFCGKKFSNTHTLKCHKSQVHQKIRNFACSLCSAQFTTRFKTMRHFQAVHSDARNYSCDFENCDSSFKTSDMLRKHQRIHFPGPYECSKCLEVFKHKSGLDYHIQLKHKETEPKPCVTYKCFDCSKEFKSSSAYDNHRKLQHPLSNQSFQPKELNPKTRREQSKVIKTPDLDLECNYCHKRYKTKANFAIHLASHENAEDLPDSSEGHENFDETEQHDEDVDALQDELQEPSDNLLKVVDEDLVSIIKFETERYVEVPVSEDLSMEPESNSIADETVEALEDEEFLAYDNDDYMVEALQQPEDEIEEAIADLEPQYLDFYAVDGGVEQTADMEESRSCNFEMIPEIANNAGVCEECGLTFKHSNQLKRHVLRRHQIDGKNFECDLCQAKFLLRYDLKRHMIKHNTKRSFQCSLCERKFKAANYLKNHVEAVHKKFPERQFVCQICDRTYIHERHLVYHVRKHQNDLRYSCRICDPPQLFHYSDAVKWHKIRHHGEPAPFICAICNRKFIHETSLKTHQKAHQKNGSLAVNCPICGKSISEKRHLKRHMRTHDEHKLSCPCGFSCKERYQLTKHTKICEMEWTESIDETIGELVYENVIEET